MKLMCSALLTVLQMNSCYQDSHSTRGSLIKYSNSPPLTPCLNTHTYTHVDTKKRVQNDGWMLMLDLFTLQAARLLAHLCSWGLSGELSRTHRSFLTRIFFLTFKPNIMAKCSGIKASNGTSVIRQEQLFYPSFCLQIPCLQRCSCEKAAQLSMWCLASFLLLHLFPSCDAADWPIKRSKRKQCEWCGF